MQASPHVHGMARSNAAHDALGDSLQAGVHVSQLVAYYRSRAVRFLPALKCMYWMAMC